MASAAEKEILRLLSERGGGKSICPSEVARALAGSDERAAWEPKMDAVREAAERLVQRGVVDVTQHGDVVDLAHARGPVRLRLKTSPR